MWLFFLDCFLLSWGAGMLGENLRKFRKLLNLGWNILEAVMDSESPGPPIFNGFWSPCSEAI